MSNYSGRQGAFAQTGTGEQSGAPTIPDHELLRQIGGGSYGQVWLARNIMGAYRAVKIVYRSNFPDERPYEREFKGIQKFEPISRTHDSQVDILHVGRNDAQGYFYYVMELADDAGKNPNGECRNPSEARKPNGEIWCSYVPRTLKLELNRRGRLPVEECIGIGLALTTALEHLHKNGLVHRDVKPSNIIYVNGIPKLADIGLVTDLDATVSFVGTEGYIPPEGPGAPQADLYSLGKVLYEACTGKDRQDFPEPPTRWEQEPNEELLRELHEILLKACERDCAKRYQSSEEVREDLKLLESGKSIRRLRVLERRVKALTRATVLGAGLLVFLTGLFLAATYRKRAQFAEKLAQERLWSSCLIQAKANHFSKRATRRFESLELVRKAANIRPALELRNEAISWIIFPDLRFGEDLPGEWNWKAFDSYDAKYDRYAHVDRAASNLCATVSVRCAKGGPEIARLKSPGAEFVYQSVTMSPGGRYVAANWSQDANWNGPSELDLWDVNRCEAVLTFPSQHGCLNADFTADDHLVAVSQCENAVKIYDLPQRVNRKRFAIGVAPIALRFSPDASRLAVSGPGPSQVQIYDAETGQLLGNFAHRDRVEGLAWHPGGELLAAGCFDKNIYLWNTSLTSCPPVVLTGHTREVKRVDFHNNGNMLASYGWDYTFRLWDVWRGAELANITTYSEEFHFNVAGDRLGVGSRNGQRPALLEVSVGRGCRSLRGLAGPQPHFANYSPRGDVLAIGGSDGLRLLNTASWQLISFLTEAAGAWASFESDDKAVICHGPAGQFRWRLVRDESATEKTIRVGPRESLADHSSDGGARLSPHGIFLASPERSEGVRLTRPNSLGSEASFLSHKGVAAVNFSPDEQWLVTAPQLADGAEVKVWAVQTGRLLTRLPVSYTAGAAFTPDSQWLIITTTDAYSFVRAGAWDLHHRVSREENSPLIGPMAISNDGKVIAITPGRAGVRIIETATGHELATLAGNDQWPLCFNRDASQLIACGEDASLKVWDLRLIRHELAAMNLDWPMLLRISHSESK